MNDAPHVVVVDDEMNVRRVLATLLEQEGYVVSKAGSAVEALSHVRAADPDLVLTDLRMPGMDGLELLDQLRRTYPEIPVVLLTAHGTVDGAVEAMKRGAYDFLTKPFDRERVLAVLSAALAQAGRRRQEFQGPLAGEARCGIVGGSLAVTRLCELIEKVAPSPSNVLVTGETGTGKELVVDALHRLSRRAGGPLVKINAAALPETLAEAELFGHEAGAFTGAERARPGRFELADGGTLFLDEVGELSAPVQAKLLRAVQERIVERVGGGEPRRVDVRLVTATHRDLAEAVAEGSFREDLLYRLRVVEIAVPPLRERLEDIPELAAFFAAKHARRLERPVPELAPEAVKALMAREWAGNVRELENLVERAVLLGEGDRLEPADFGFDDEEPPAPAAEGPLKDAARAAAASVERRMIRAALGTTGNNVTRAAARLGLSRRGLQMKMKELGLRP